MLAWLFGIIVLSSGGKIPQIESVADTAVRPHVDTVANRILHVGRVIIIGNKVTRNRIIEREISKKPGDTVSLSQLPGILQWDKNKIYNLRLFNTVSVRALELGDDRIDILVEVTERWYIFPVPIFELSDRNFSEWWNNYNHDLSRINYGLRVYNNNFRGRNESLRFTAQFGFVQKFDLQYKIPNLDRKQKQGIVFYFDFGSPKNHSVRTEDHKLIFIELSSVVKRTAGGSIGYSYRKSFYETHSVELGYRQNEIADTVLNNQLKYNAPPYFNNGKTTQKYFEFTYAFVSEHRDVVMYPLKGYNFSAYIRKTGIFSNDDVNQLEINVMYSRHWPLGNNYFLSNFSSALLSTVQNQPYNLYNALGYRNQILRGYENYVVEGPAFALNKTTLKKKILTRLWIMDSMPMEQFKYVPLAIYIKAFADMGYVKNYAFYDEKGLNKTFSNRYLIGAGFGLDVVTMYDLALRFEYTFIQQQPGAFYFNVRKEF
jgi:outer membrane protein assembly factor BamA